MRLKRYRGATASEALAMVNRELGPDALILSTRELGPTDADGLDGGVEVVAGADSDARVLQALTASDGEGLLLDGTGLPAVRAAGSPMADEAPAAAQQLYDLLVEHGVDETVAEHLLVAALERIAVGRRIDRRAVERALVEETSARVPAWRLPAEGPLAVIGPPGAGSTTVVARLLSQRPGATYVCADTERAAATHAARAYATALGVPLVLAYGADEVRQAVREDRRAVVELPSLPGETLAAAVGQAAARAVLVAPACWSPSAFGAWAERALRHLAPDAVVVTQADLVGGAGVLGVALGVGRPVAGISTSASALQPLAPWDAAALFDALSGAGRPFRGRAA